MFQCSSASRKFLNHSRDVIDNHPTRSFSALQRAENSSIASITPTPAEPRTSFSALQRAENSSIPSMSIDTPVPTEFQCSSASRKFLNLLFGLMMRAAYDGFSALQRAENSSMPRPGRYWAYAGLVSVLFSEPKIPQWHWRLA